MGETKIHKVRFEPVGVEMEVREDETVLEAAFRQGITLMHGCKEGQCASCKSLLCEGELELSKYSTFALPDFEREQNYVLLCRSHALSDVVVELVSYDEELLSRSIPVKEYFSRITAIEPLTHDIHRLELELDQDFKFWAGQYVDITIPETGITRSYSMANAPGAERKLEFIIKVYPGGAFSSKLEHELKPGFDLLLKGPYGACFRREQRPGRLLLIGGGSGMAPLWSILIDLVRSGESRPVTFFYGARTRRDLFYLDKFESLKAGLDQFEFIPALSEPAPDDDWHGATGFIHESVASYVRENPQDEETEAYCCGPPPMIDAVVPALLVGGLEPEHIYLEKFTQAVRREPPQEGTS